MCVVDILGADSIGCFIMMEIELEKEKNMINRKHGRRWW